MHQTFFVLEILVAVAIFINDIDSTIDFHVFASVQIRAQYFCRHSFHLDMVARDYALETFIPFFQRIAVGLAVFH
jgi:hypothetical protein